MKNKEKIVVWAVPVLILVVIVAIGVVNAFCNDDFWNATVTQIITLIVAIVVAFYITQYKNDERKIKDHAEIVIRKIQDSVMDEQFTSIELVEEQKQITMTNRKVSNYITILKQYGEKLKFVEDAKYIDEEFQRYRTFVDEHLSDKEYLAKSKTTLLNHAEKIEQKCELIILNLYK